ncbi:unnamed protein product [Angiostrongylus costaricensis]|uniref:Vps4_C domain-containing protein n=1 Tax=Angiostrongylus costaricensis TaxID=334426 RepID=A0A0R3Q0Z3_ANGCS|nr:unnamed protein product [Angiostrongylus costaricensis]
MMALLDRKRTSDLKMLRQFVYPKELSKLVAEYDKVQAFAECGEKGVRLLRRVDIVTPDNYKGFFKDIKMEESESN